MVVVAGGVRVLRPVVRWHCRELRDGTGKSKIETDLKNRARQNVILELGYFIGKLTRNKVCPLYVPGVELPSDLLILRPCLSRTIPVK